MAIALLTLLCFDPSRALAQEQDFIPIDHKGQNPSSHIGYLPNKGQLTAMQGGLVPDVLYYSIQCSPQLFLTKKNEIFFQIGTRDSVLATPDLIHRVGLKFVGPNANASCQPNTYEDQSDFYNFVLGHCPNGIYGVHASRRVVYPDLYPGIDLHLYSNAFGPKMYLVMRPGSDPDDLLMEFQGQDSLLLDLFGNLKAYVENGVVILPKGLCYQQIGNATELVSAGLPYDLTNGVGQVKFMFGSYNPEYPLIVDVSANFGAGGGDVYPTPEWCTFYGNTEIDRSMDAIVLPTGDFVTAGGTYSPQFPLFNQQMDFFDGGAEGFYSLFNNDYERRFTTFFGGNGVEEVYSIALSPEGSSVYLFGTTFSTNLPLVGNNGYSQSYQGEGCYIAKFSLTSNPVGQPEHVTYFGDPRNTHTCPCIRTDNIGNVYVTGTSYSPTSAHPLINSCTAPAQGFPMCNSMGSGAYFQDFSGGGTDAYLARFDPNMNLVHCTRFGGYNTEFGDELTIDKDRGLILMTGSTMSQRRGYNNCEPPLIGPTNMSFPLCDPGSGYFQSNLNGTNLDNQSDAYVAAFRITDDKLVWSTFFGGEGDEFFSLVGLNTETGSLTLSGITSTTSYAQNNCSPPTSAGLPRCGLTLQGYGGGSHDLFIARFDLDDYSLKWSTFLGGGGYEEPRSIRFRAGTQMILSGFTRSGSNNAPNFPTTSMPNAYVRPTHNDPNAQPDANDGFIAILDELEGDHLELSTYLGGVGNDGVNVAVADGLSRIYVAGLSYSTADVPFKCPPTDAPYCYLSYATITPNQTSDVLYAQILDDLTISIEHISGPLNGSGALLVYPNPTSRICTIELAESLLNEGLPILEVFDATGRIVQRPLVIRASGSTLQWTLVDPAPGAYLVRVIDTNSRWSRTGRFLVQ